MARFHRKSKRPPRPRLRGWLFWGCAALLWGLFLLWSWMPPAASAVERFYSLGLYRHIVGAVAPLTAQLPFSLALVLLGGGIVLFPCLWAANWIYAKTQGRSHISGLLWGFKWGLATAPVLLTWFLVFWGAGYQRMPAESRLELDTSRIKDAEADELRALCLSVIKNDAPSTQDRDVDRALASVSETMAAVIEEWDGRPVWLPRRVKATPKGMLLANGTSGVCSPITLEPHVDGALPDTAFVSVGAHELAHIAGICSEAEANLVSYAAGLRASDPYARYAVALGLYRAFAGRLQREEQKEAFKLLPQAAQDDLNRAAEISKHYRIRIFERLSWRAYNQYLKSRGVEDGVKNYARGVSLFTYLWRKGGAAFPEGTQPDPAVFPPPGAPAAST